MHIEYLVTKNPNKGSVSPSKKIDYLVGLEGTLHNGPAARLLCAAATWAYSDLTTFASMMCNRGLYGEFIGVNVTNEAAFIDTTAYLFLSEDKRVAILTFRGTELTNIVNWLADASTETEPQEEGGIHRGFLTSVIVVLPVLRDLLLGWANSDPSMNLHEGIAEMKKKRCYPEQAYPQVLEPTPSSETSLPAALYICGHSLGGALAQMAGALLHLDPTLFALREKLRSVYTFGAPMFADKTLADKLQAEFGERVFRHRYEKDVVPLLPGRQLGNYDHFGHGYVSSEGVWVRRDRKEEPADWSMPAIIIGLVAFAKEKVPALRWVPLPVSWADHSPLRYMETSEAPRAGWEILGWELGGDVPGSCNR